MASLWAKFTDIFSRNKSGVVPQAPSGIGTSKYLREDGTWAVPPGGGGGGHNYSTTEQVVGTWLDGKPLYEKTIHLTNISFNANFYHVHGIANADIIWLENVILIPTEDTGSGKTASTSGGGLGSSNSNTIIGARIDRTAIYGNGGEAWGAFPYRHWIFIVKYTKTTD